MWKRDNSNPKNTPFLNPTLTPRFPTHPPPPPPPPPPRFTPTTPHPPPPLPRKKKIKSIQMVLCMYLSKTEY